MCTISDCFNRAGIVYGIGASVMLHYLGLVEDPHDIDILVTPKCVQNAVGLLSRLGVGTKQDKSGVYLTERFYKFNISGENVDLMCGFGVRDEAEGVCTMYPFDASCTPCSREICGVNVKFTTPEEWFVLYLLIPGREPKVEMLQNYLLCHGANTALLERSLRWTLPARARRRVESLLEKLTAAK